MTAPDEERRIEHTCWNCNYVFSVVFSPVAFGPQITVSVKCPRCEASNDDILIGTFDGYRVEEPGR